MVDSVLGYGVEVWGPELLCQDPLSNDCERVQLLALKWLFGVRKSTASCIVLAEAGRWPLALCWVKRLARFYNSLVSAPRDSLLNHAFISNCNLTANPLDNSNTLAAKQSWAAQLQKAFGQWGVEISLEEPREVNVNDVCARWQEWYLDRVHNCTGTKIHKYVHVTRKGLPANECQATSCLQIPDFRKRQRAVQFRMEAHSLREETGRWEKLEREKRTCKQCSEQGMEECETVF